MIAPTAHTLPSAHTYNAKPPAPPTPEEPAADRTGWLRRKVGLVRRAVSVQRPSYGTYNAQTKPRPPPKAPAADRTRKEEGGACDWSGESCLKGCREECGTKVTDGA